MPAQRMTMGPFRRGDIAQKQQLEKNEWGSAELQVIFFGKALIINLLRKTGQLEKGQ